MSEPNFAALREHLESTARESDFDEIRTRRQRRTQRWAMAGVAAATVIAVTAGALTLDVLRGTGSDPAIAPTRSASPTPSLSIPAPDGAVPATLAGLAAAPSGRLFALAQRSTSVTLLRSADSGATWTSSGRLPASRDSQLRLVVASDTQMWVLTETTVYATSDGGHNWIADPLAPTDPSRAAEAGGTLWLIRDGAILVASNGGRPARTLTQPGALVDRISALTADRAVAVTNGANPTWYRTSDRGRHWTKIANPCAGTRYTRSWQPTMAQAPDGSQWLVCAGEPGTGQLPKDLTVSTDGGTTWHPRGALESSGYASSVYPMSSTVAWRTGDRADLYRTTDGTHWTDVVAAGDNQPDVRYLTPVSSTDAVYALVDQDGGRTRIYQTRDGGHTWTYHLLPR